MLLSLPLPLLGLSTCLGRRVKTSPPGLCSTVSCRTAALALNVSLSRTVGPCEDMQHFVCDGWLHTDLASACVEMIMNCASTAFVGSRRGQSAVDKVIALLPELRGRPVARSARPVARSASRWLT
ncbi:hypothetical protein HPB48_014634 [Haemaphysalis longicornis]|uniref:Secreted protein n=1 Tax=Haemaphysalis longicornis TaxID=44386 RepID=A0A9J6GBJ7_HAELO|nr:hypothetical protein HPB48_014634 [Haemaphysalis longicornis]